MKKLLGVASTVVAMACEPAFLPAPNDVMGESGSPADEAAGGQVEMVPPELGPRWPGPCLAATFPADPQASVATARVEHAYDDFGRRTDQWWDRDGDAQPDLHVLYSYDPVGRAISESWDEGFDGQVDSMVHYEWAEGRQVRTLSDWNNDGLADAILTMRFDAEGRAASQDSDEDGDGAPEQRRVFGWEGSGRLVWVAELDLVAGATVNMETYEYDPTTGLLVATNTDSGADGSLDWQTIHTYDLDGLTTSETQMEFVTLEGSKPSAVARSLTTFAHDAFGNQMEEFEERFDGEAGRRVLFDYTCWQD